MTSGLIAALGAGLLWGLVFVTPLILGDYPGLALAVGRYLAFGLLAVVLAAFDRRALAQLQAADWLEAARLAVVGNLLYYATLASAIQLVGGPLPTLIIGMLPVVIALCANLSERGGHDSVPWRRLPLPLGVMLAGLLIVHGGALDTAGSRRGDDPAGILLALLALACWTWYPIRNGRWLRARGSHLARAWATAQGLMTLPLALLAGLAWRLLDPDAFAWPLGPRPASFVGMMLLLGLAASWLGTLLWNRASHRLPAALLGQLIVFETLAALVYAFIWYQRWPDPAETVGILLLIGGVLLGVRVFRLPRQDQQAEAGDVPCPHTEPN